MTKIAYSRTNQEQQKRQEIFNEADYQIVRIMLMEARGDMEKFIAACQKANLWPLHLAGQFGDLRMLRKLVEVGFDPEECDDQGRTVLQVCAGAKKAKLVRFLVREVGVNCNLIDSSGKSAMDWAISNGDFRTMLELLRIEDQALVTMPIEVFATLVSKVNPDSFPKFSQLMAEKISAEVDLLKDDSAVGNTILLDRLKNFERIIKVRKSFSQNKDSQIMMEQDQEIVAHNIDDGQEKWAATSVYVKNPDRTSAPELERPFINPASFEPDLSGAQDSTPSSQKRRDELRKKMEQLLANELQNVSHSTAGKVDSDIVASNSDELPSSSPSNSSHQTLTNSGRVSERR